MNGAVKQPLADELAVADSTQDKAIGLLHGEYKYWFKKILIIYFQVWLICLPAMTSACVFKYALRNGNQVFPNFELSTFEICLHPVNFNFTAYFLILSNLTRNPVILEEIPLYQI